MEGAQLLPERLTVPRALISALLCHHIGYILARKLIYV